MHGRAVTVLYVLALVVTVVGTDILLQASLLGTLTGERRHRLGLRGLLPAFPARAWRLSSRMGSRSLSVRTTRSLSPPDGWERVELAPTQVRIRASREWRGQSSFAGTPQPRPNSSSESVTGRRAPPQVERLSRPPMALVRRIIDTEAGRCSVRPAAATSWQWAGADRRVGAARRSATGSS